MRASLNQHPCTPHPPPFTQALRTLLAAACTIVAASSAVFAHEFWIDPASMRVAVNTPIKLDLKVGCETELTILPRDPSRFERFVMVSPSDESDVAGVDGRAPAGIARPMSAGVHVVAYRSTSSTVDLDAAKFEKYLRDEGLEYAIQRRAELGQTNQRGRERFSRCAKALVVVGDAPRENFDKVLGLPFEIIPDQDPRDVGATPRSTFRALLNGKPLPNALVRATRMDAEKILAARTDAEGRVSFALPSEGRWRLNAVHVTELPKDDAQQWESLWASLVFEAGEPAKPGAAAKPRATDDGERWISVPDAPSSRGAGTQRP
jgi:uncharacterized GH25 family protein